MLAVPLIKQELHTPNKDQQTKICTNVNTVDLHAVHNKGQNVHNKRNCMIWDVKSPLKIQS